MLIRCIRTFIPNNGKKFIVNHDMQRRMATGNEYVVYGISVSEEAIYYLIFQDHLFSVPAQLFEIIEGSVSPLWEIRSNASGNLEFFPPLFYEEDFWENFSEWEDKERNSFSELQKHFPPQVEYKFETGLGDR